MSVAGINCSKTTFPELETANAIVLETKEWLDQSQKLLAAAGNDDQISDHLEEAKGLRINVKKTIDM
jgi:hypothetical protein